MKTTPTVAVSLLVVVLSAAQLSSARFINPLDIFQLSSARSVDESLEVCKHIMILKYVKLCMHEYTHCSEIIPLQVCGNPVLPQWI